MEKYFVVQNLNLVVQNTKIIEDLNFNISSSVCLLGESGSGKSLLLKSLLKTKKYETNGTVSFYLGEKKPFNYLQGDYDKDTYEFLSHFFSEEDDYKYALWQKIKNFPDFLFCEELHLEEKDFLLFLDFLKNKNIKIFYVTHDVEQTLYFEYLYVLKNGKIAIEGKTPAVLKEEKIMKRLGFSLPFYINLSKQLGYYGLSHQICTNKEELEESLWPSI